MTFGRSQRLGNMTYTDETQKPRVIVRSALIVFVCPNPTNLLAVKHSAYARRAYLILERAEIDFYKCFLRENQKTLANVLLT